MADTIRLGVRARTHGDDAVLLRSTASRLHASESGGRIDTLTGQIAGLVITSTADVVNGANDCALGSQGQWQTNVAYSANAKALAYIRGAKVPGGDYLHLHIALNSDGAPGATAFVKVAASAETAPFNVNLSATGTNQTLDKWLVIDLSQLADFGEFKIGVSGWWDSADQGFINVHLISWIISPTPIAEDSFPDVIAPYKRRWAMNVAAWGGYGT